jgi:hypothetical protein
MAYDFARGRTLLFASGVGDTDTWALAPATVPTFARHGTGCPGSSGIPSLDRVGNAVPALGTTLPLVVTALPPQPGFVWLAFGFELLRWNGALLPAALAPFGLPGCSLWVAPEAGFLIARQNGTAAMPVAIPAHATLIGVRLGAQALSFDPGAPGGFGAVSNAAILRVR